jgi:hypothetical protein
MDDEETFFSIFSFISISVQWVVRKNQSGDN